MAENNQSMYITVLLFLSAQLKNISLLTENCRLQIVKNNSETSLNDFEGQNPSKMWKYIYIFFFSIKIVC